MKALVAFDLAAFLLANLVFGSNLRAQTTQPGEPAKTLAELKDDARKRLDIQWHNLSSVGQRQLADVISFKMANDRLVVATNLPNSQTTQAITIAGYPGQAIYRFVPSRHPDGGFLVLERYDFSDPDLIDVHEMVLSTPTVLQLVQDIEMPDRTQTVELTQGANEEQGVALRVQTVSESDGRVLVSLKLQGASLTAIRREHRDEFQKYLRPLLHALGGEAAVFGVDEKLAWQVVSDTFQSPADVQAKVIKILDDFNSDSYNTRAAAQENLGRMGEPAAVFLLGMDRKNLSGEQAARVDEFLHPYRPASPEQCKALRTDVSFLLEGLGSEDPRLRAAILQHLQSAVGMPIAFDMKMNAMDRDSEIEKLRKELLPLPATVPSTQP